ncbi:hypothetical protein ACQEVZ_20145 [Dactylosporangium sp. CA-152071]|uniref:hypothetical protein n=1 Tax=Dactylosporangium sp. CA-152071 TaxID=3239933 RepID=UPI003D938698
MSRTLPDTRPHLTRAERDLFTAVRRHLRADGWTVYGDEAEHRGARIAADWTYPWSVDGKTGRILRIKLLTALGSTQRIAADVDVDSVQEAVDVAVALGLLPQGMSSVYQAGLEAPTPPVASPQPWLPRDWRPEAGDDRPLPRPLGLTPIPDPALRQDGA